MSRLMRRGQHLTLDEHRELAMHIRAAMKAIQAICRILSGRALQSLPGRDSQQRAFLTSFR